MAKEFIRPVCVYYGNAEFAGVLGHANDSKCIRACRELIERLDEEGQ